MESRNHPRRPIRRPGILAREFDSETILFDPDTDSTHSLNVTAHTVWRLCDGRRTVQEIITEMGRTYGVDPGEIASDVSDIISQLKRLGFLTQAQQE